MKLYVFRYKKFQGFATGKNMTQLFWNIDSFIDPYCVEIQEVQFFAVCWKNKDEEQTNFAFESDWDEDKWIKPDWSKVKK